MNETIESIKQMSAVTISREYGSGGGEIASRLAKRLRWQLLDHALVERVASTLGTSQEEAEIHDEHVEGVLTRVLTCMQYLYPAMLASLPPEAFLSDEAYRDTVNRLVKAAALRGHMVIVGRGAQLLLANRPDVLHVRVIAPLEQRIAYVMQREEVNRARAVARIHRKDHDRAKYLEAEYHRKPEDASLYDLVLRASFLDLESAVDIICLALQHKARRLFASSSSAQHLAGLSPYPGPLVDFHPSRN
jgi:CMP/dCMP kinase